MQYSYESNPKKIEEMSFHLIRKLCDLSIFSLEQQQVVMRIIHSLGLPHLLDKIKFSERACEAGIEAVGKEATILCDVEMVKQGITKRMTSNEPLCFLNHETVARLAKKNNKTRSMAAIELWKPYLENSIVIIGNAPTALFRLLEMLEEQNDKPALVIGMPVGFIGAEESKQVLWDRHKNLGIECITLLGREGGSAVSSATCNALLRCYHGEYY